MSSYRLGDLIIQELNETIHNEILLENPDSIGSEYIKEYYHKKSGSKHDVICKIVLNKMNEIKNTDQYVPDIENSIVVHLRLGDVMCGNLFHEIQKRPIELEYYKELKKKYPTTKFYLIGNCFFSKEYMSENKDESIERSNAYLNDIMNILEATHINGSADFDLCCAVKSKLFVQGRGFYSMLIVLLRNMFSLPSIQNQSHIW